MSTKKISIISLALATLAGGFLVGCTAMVSDLPGIGGEDGGDGGDGEGSLVDSGIRGSDDETICVTDGSSGTQCEIVGDCEAPLICVDGICIGPRNPDIRCSAIEGIYCEEGKACAVGVCVTLPGVCAVTDDCPIGYLCSGGTCTPERDGEVCPIPGPGPQLSGTYDVDSKLYLRQGLSDSTAKILGVFEDIRNIVQGRINLGLPRLVESIIGSLVSSVIRSYLPPWAVNFSEALGDFSDVLDTTAVESVLTLKGSECSGAYRAKEVWKWVSFQYRGRNIRVRPDQLPGVPGGRDVSPDEFSARFDCGTLYFSKHRIRDSLAGLIRFLLDNISQAITGITPIEDAVVSIIDCRQVARSLNGECRNRAGSGGGGGGFIGGIIGGLLGGAGSAAACSGIDSTIRSACEAVKRVAADQLGDAIDEAAVKLSLIKRSGAIDVSESGDLSNGRWFGSLGGRDFPGEFTMSKR